MNLELKIINPLNYQGWDELVLSTGKYSFFHTSAWARVLYESYHYKPHYFTLLDKKEPLVLVPVMEVKSIWTGPRGVSLPFSDYCMPIIGKGIEFDNVLNSMIKYGKKCRWKSLEYRNGNHFSQEISPSSFFYGHTLSLSKDVDQIFSRFRSSTSRNIRKAIREGVQVIFSYSLESIKEYYRLHNMTRKKHGIPSQPFYFFKNIYDNIISKKYGLVILASYEKKNIAGSVFFHFGNKAMYKFGASNIKYQHLRANNLIMWEAIKWYAEQGYESFCFGKTEPDNIGLKQFKDGWATKEELIKYFKYDLIKDSFIKKNQKLTGFHNKIFAKMPISLLQLSGKLIYRHIA